MFKHTSAPDPLPKGDFGDSQVFGAIEINVAMPRAVPASVSAEDVHGPLLTDYFQRNGGKSGRRCAFKEYQPMLDAGIRQTEMFRLRSTCKLHGAGVDIFAAGCYICPYGDAEGELVLHSENDAVLMRIVLAASTIVVIEKEGAASLHIAGKLLTITGSSATDTCMKLLAWCLRQYCAVTPPDQNHDPQPNNPCCCAHNFERCASCGARCINTIWAVLPCCWNTCGRGVRCVCDDQARLKERDNEQSCICAIGRRLAFCTGLPLVCFYSSVRACGSVVGSFCQGRMEEFSGPPQNPCAHGTMDCIGAIGNTVTICYKAAFRTPYHILQRLSWERMEEIRRNHGDAAAQLAYTRFQCCLGMCEACMNLYAISELGLTSLPLTCISECFDHLVNRDIYTQGPVLLQGLVDFNGLKSVWAVMRPWALSIYWCVSFMGVQPLFVLGTSNMMMVRWTDTDVYERPCLTLRTLDFMNFRIRETAESRVSLLQWYEVLEKGCDRVEDIQTWDQGVERLILQESPTYKPCLLHPPGIETMKE